MIVFVWSICVVARCTPPKCAVCEYGKAHQNPIRAITTNPSPERKGTLKSNDLFSGSGVTVDHFELRVPDCLYTSLENHNALKIIKEDAFLLITLHTYCMSVIRWSFYLTDYKC